MQLVFAADRYAKASDSRYNPIVFKKEKEGPHLMHMSQLRGIRNPNVAPPGFIDINVEPLGDVWYRSTEDDDFKIRFRLELPEKIFGKVFELKNYSCNDMFITNPPTKQIRVSIATTGVEELARRPRDVRYRYVKIEREDGVKVGDLIELWGRVVAGRCGLKHVNSRKSWIDIFGEPIEESMIIIKTLDETEAV